MSNIPELVPISDLRQDAAAVIRRVRDRKEPVVITQRGRAAAVMVGIEAHERSEREREILIHLARGEKEIAEGKNFGLDDVLSEADAILKEEIAVRVAFHSNGPRAVLGRHLRTSARTGPRRRFGFADGWRRLCGVWKGSPLPAA